MEKSLLDILPGIKHPIIMAPMFLVSDAKMIIEATRQGITAAIPALNYRSIESLHEGLSQLKKAVHGPFGVNIIVNKSNPLHQKQLSACIENKVDFVITSLGNPKEVIEKCHQHGIKVFCDVVDAKHAAKVSDMRADALIAVNKVAGGHSGDNNAKHLLHEIRKVSQLPIICAGGISTKDKLKETLQLGYAGASIGTIFIASKEAPVNDDYKNACIKYGAKDIVRTTKLSGTPCTVINTPYVQQTGTRQNTLEKLLNKNKRLKIWMKALTFYKGMKALRASAFSTTYKTVWCAGPSIEDIKSIKPIKEIVTALTV